MMQKELVNRREIFSAHMGPKSSGYPGDRPHAVHKLLGSFVFILVLLYGPSAYPQTSIPIATGSASYYTVASCLKEGTSGICANGEVLNDNRKIAASWFYSFGTRLKVSRLDKKGKTLSSVIVVVTDRGPAKRLVRKGRIIDLSARAFAELAPLSQGIIRVSVEKI